MEQIAVLFDLYRQFYGQPPDLAAVKSFITERLDKSDSFLLGAFHNDTMIGFTQLYPSFSSTAMTRKLILNDLFVLKEHRRTGVARALLQAAEKLGRETGSISLVLATQKENEGARKLYEESGWIEESTFVYYNKACQ